MIQFTAKVRFIRFSPYKLRPLADVIRGKNAAYALGWLRTYPVNRATPIRKMVESAIANAKNLKNIEPKELVIKDIRIDVGPMFRYFKPGAMGRANIYRKRSSHMSIVLEPVKAREE